MKNAPTALRQNGLSLIELMVALVIGLVTTLVIMQVFSVFEDQKRATTGSADAKTSDNIALYLIARDLQMLDGAREVPAGRPTSVPGAREGSAAAAQAFQAPPVPGPAPQAPPLDFDDDIPF